MTRKKETAGTARTLPPRPRRNPIVGAGISVLMLAVIIGLWVMMSNGGPQVEQMTMASALDDAYRPVTPTETFKPGETFFVSVTITSYQSDQDIQARWRFNGGDVGKTTLETHDKAGTITAGFSLSNQDPWPEGKYTVDIMNGDKVLGSANFTVAK